MEKILALDLGTNSIGWAIRNTAVKGNQIVDFGVITFKRGVGIDKTGEYSYAAQRTKKRATRRLYQARKYRLWRTLDVLIKYGFCPLEIGNLNRWRKYNKEEALLKGNSGREYPIDDLNFDAWIKLDFNFDGKPEYTSPYQLRKELSEVKLDMTLPVNKHKLGRALYHIAQRRGFKSSRNVIDETKSKESDNASITDEELDLQYSEKKKNKVIIELFNEYPEAKTIGSLFACIEKDKVRIRENIAQFAIRENYKDEIKYVFAFQQISENSELFTNLVESGRNKNDGAIFYKRPLRSQKGLIGKCTLEPNKYRAPVSHPSFEFFRAWSFLNNIKYKCDDLWLPIPLEIRQRLYNKFFLRKSKPHFPFSEISDYIKKEQFDWVLNYSPKTTVSGCPVSARLKDIFGENFMDLKIKKNREDKSGSDFYSIEDIWHVLFSFDEQEYVSEFAQNKLALNDLEVKEFVRVWNAIPVGYAMLSLNAINKINAFLTKGLIYTEAVLLANLPKVLGKELWKENEDLLLTLISQLIEENRYQKRVASIANTLISNHKNIINYKNGGSDYVLDKDDFDQIEIACSDSYGEKTWNNLGEENRKRISSFVTDLFQAYFKEIGHERVNIDGERYRLVVTHGKKFYKADSSFYLMPKLRDTLADFLKDNFSISDKQRSQIYHPSEISIYPHAREDKDGMIRLGSPKTGSFKNPMAMRTLHELRKLTNYLLDTHQIDADTHIVVEVARELNDANMRWAIETWQRRREEENNEFAIAIGELFNVNKIDMPNHSKKDDIDKMRIWFEQIAIDSDGIPPIVDNKKEIKGVFWNSTKSESYKEIAAKKSQIDKYRLWLEQDCRCIYTGRVISLSELFSETSVDFEHTLPRSKSFDNSLENLTVCDSHYNRNIKKNQIPYDLQNFSAPAIINNVEYSAIQPRLEKWKEKIARINQQVEFWRGKSKRAMDKDSKDNAIRQRHLWQMEYNYWKNKVDRFETKEITNGFKNSQKVDTQLISKYAYHYLSSYFNKVIVQKGSITAEFRKIFGLQSADEKKDRSKHSHHAKDAAILTLIPFSTKRDNILQTYYEHKENFKTFTTEPYAGFKREYIMQIDDSILINNSSKNQTLTPARRIVRKRGKEQYICNSNIPKIATGDCIRGQLHDETFFGAIKLGEKDEAGRLKRDEAGCVIQNAQIRFVVRTPLKFKKNDNDTGFKTIDELGKVMVDSYLFRQIQQQVEAAGGLKEALEEGVFMINSKGEKENRIRRVRVFKSISEPLKIKQHTFLSKHDYKQHYYAANATNSYFAYYEGNGILGFEIRNLFDTAGLLANSTIKQKTDLFESVIVKSKGKNTSELQLKYVLENGMKVLFLSKDEDLSALKNLDIQTLSKRLYIFTNFEKDGRLNFRFHMEARENKEIKEDYKESVIDFENPKPTLRFSYSSYRFVVESVDFKIMMDGKLKWL